MRTFGTRFCCLIAIATTMILSGCGRDDEVTQIDPSEMTQEQEDAYAEYDKLMSEE